MKIKNKGLRLHYKLVMHFASGTRQCTSTYKKMKIVHRLTSASWQKAYLKVVYGKDGDEYNDGWYETKSDVLAALRQFTEKPLIDYLCQGGGDNEY